MPVTVHVAPLQVSDGKLISVGGSLDMQTTAELDQTCQSLMRTGSKRLLFDLSRLEYINSQGMGVILQLQKQLWRKGGGVALAACSDRVGKIFLATGIDKVIPVYRSVKQALAEDPMFTGG